MFHPDNIHGWIGTTPTEWGQPLDDSYIFDQEIEEDDDDEYSFLEPMGELEEPAPASDWSPGTPLPIENPTEVIP